MRKAKCARGEELVAIERAFAPRARVIFSNFYLDKTTRRVLAALCSSRILSAPRSHCVALPLRYSKAILSAACICRAKGTVRGVAVVVAADAAPVHIFKY